MMSEEVFQLDTYSEKMYLGYAIATLKDRAIPYLMDGLKPVQRRILHAMDELGLDHKAKHVKSARVVGEVLGKFHPHGDASAYEAMVRMSQDFSLRYPLVDGQGNFGSRDGDSAAAMRYTESRLSKISNLIMAEKNMETVDWVRNYDNTMDEPKLLPSRLNFLLMNGAMGIAVGMATDIPPHNVVELHEAMKYVMSSKKPNVDGIMAVMPGPDFPNGGQIVSPASEIKKGYETGISNIRVRCRWKIENLARNQWRVVIYELPPGVSTRVVLENVGKISSPGNKKADERQLINSILSAARDESSKDDAVRIVLEPKNSKIDSDEFMNTLIGRLGLEQTVKINMTSIGLDGSPRTKSLITMIQEWLEYRNTTVKRRTLYHLNKNKARQHILQGREKILLHIDEVIHIIRHSDDPKEELMVKYDLSEIQVLDILEIRLRQLARMETVAVIEELKKVSAEVIRLEGIYSSSTKIRNIVKKEIADDTKLYADDRRTIIKAATPVVASKNKIEISNPCTIFITEKGWLINKNGWGIENTAIPTKQDDTIIYSIEINTNEDFVMLDNGGKGFSLRANEVASSAKWTPIKSLVEIKDINYAGKVGEMILLSSGDGYGFVLDNKQLLTRNKNGKVVMTTAAEINKPIIINDDELVAVYSSDKRLLVYELSEIKTLNKGKGVQLMKLPSGVLMDELVLFTDKLVINGKKVPKTKIEYYTISRAKRGKMF
jgi:topoisomerase-4 subunit A